MKKIICVLLGLVICISMFACSSKEEDEQQLDETLMKTFIIDSVAYMIPDTWVVTEANITSGDDTHGYLYSPTENYNLQDGVLLITAKTLPTLSSVTLKDYYDEIISTAKESSDQFSLIHELDGAVAGEEPLLNVAYYCVADSITTQYDVNVFEHQGTIFSFSFVQENDGEMDGPIKDNSSQILESVSFISPDSELKVKNSTIETLEQEVSSLESQLEEKDKELEEFKEQTLIPQYKEEAAPVVEAINNIGDVTLDKEQSIIDASVAYDALSDSAKEYVTNIETLTNAEAQVETLKAEAEAAAAAAEAAKSEEEKKQEYMAACIDYSYTELARDPAPYIGTQAKFRGKVVQVIEGFYSTSYRINVTQGSYGTWSDTIYVVYYPSTDEKRILEDDIVTVYGEMRDLYSYTTVMNTTVTIPSLNAKYIVLE